MNVKSNHSEWCEELASITPDHMERINRRYRIKNFVYKSNSLSVQTQVADTSNQMGWCVDAILGVHKIFIWLNPESLRPFAGITAQRIEQIYSHPLYVDMLFAEILTQLGLKESTIEKFSKPSLKNIQFIHSQFDKEKPELLQATLFSENTSMFQFCIAANVDWIDQTLLIAQQPEVQQKKLAQLSEIKIILDEFSISEEEFHAMESNDVIQTNLSLLKKVDHGRLLENIQLNDIFKNTSPNWMYEINHRSWKYESDQWHETLTPSVLFKSENTVTLQMVLHLNSDHLSLLATDALCQIKDGFMTLQAIFPDKEITIPVKVCGYQNTVVLKII